MNTVADLQKAFMRLLNSIGRYRIERKQNSLHIVRERAFVGIHLKKRYLGVNVVLDRPDVSPPASKVEQVSAHRYHHYYKITSVKELNRSFARLLRKAYDLAEPGKTAMTKGAD